MVKLTLSFSDNLKPEVEYFAKRSQALQFAREAYNNGYIVEKSGKTVIYPYYIMRQMVIEETSDKPEKHSRRHPTQELV